MSTKKWFYGTENGKVYNFRPPVKHVPIDERPDDSHDFNAEKMEWVVNKSRAKTLELKNQKKDRAEELYRIDQILFHHFKEVQLFEQDLLSADELEAVKTYLVALRDFPEAGTYPERPDLVDQAFAKRGL